MGACKDWGERALSLSYGARTEEEDRGTEKNREGAEREGGETDHAAMAGKPEYAPVTTRKVPKYFALMGAGERLMAYPMRESEKPARTKGERFLSRSDQIPQRMTVMAM